MTKNTTAWLVASFILFVCGVYIMASRTDLQSHGQTFAGLYIILMGFLSASYALVQKSMLPAKFVCARQKR